MSAVFAADTSNRISSQSWQLGSTVYTESYTYDEDDGSLSSMQPAVGGSLSFTYDALKRLSGQANGVYRKFYGYEKDGTNATTRLDYVSYASTDGNNLAGFTLYYDYDQRGNIAVVTSNSTSFPSAVYTYDIQGQLTQEILGGVTYNYTYDTYGNIVQVSGGASHTYTYGDEEWRDLLTAYDGYTIEYDNIGNPTSYFNGARWNFTWQKGRQLASATFGTSTYTYTYDLAGIRNSKTVNGTTYNYLTQNGKVVRQYWGTNVMDFIYDNSGNPYAMVYNGDVYYYILNQQGDVIRIVSPNGSTHATYVYNAWGKLMDCSGWLATTNPIRYRGYYYDNETGFYYLQSRYYDPSIGRFINSDELATTGQGFLGCNMFAYCGNNPVSRSDSDGAAFETVLDVISLAGSLVDVARNPSDPWAWAGLAGDVLDVAVPFVAGAGELIRAAKTADKIVDAVDAVDDAHDTVKAVCNVSESVSGACFVAGTSVLTENGYTAIEEVEAGDYVWAWNEETGDVALKRVVETYINQTQELIHVFVNGEEIITTPTHPFYSPVMGWTDAAQLRAGDILVLVNGEYVVIEKIQHEILEAPVTVYNFQVEDYHTYYVTDAGVLVHNKCLVDDILNGATETTSKNGITRNFNKSGGYIQAEADFYYLQPNSVKSIHTKYGDGLVGKTSNNFTIVVRPGSKTGGATLEINISSRNRIKIRY